MARMKQLMEAGCSVLFVSHSIDAVRALCDEVIWLEAGKIKMKGEVTEVTNAYMNEVFIEHNRIVMHAQSLPSAADLPATESDQQEAQESPMETERARLSEALKKLNGGRVVEVESIILKNSQNQEVDTLLQDEEFAIEVTVVALHSIQNLSTGILIKNEFGQELTGESYFNTYRQSLNLRKGERVGFVFRSKMQLRGGQSYSVALRMNQVSKWDRTDNILLYADEVALVFKVLYDSDNPMWFQFRMPFGVSRK